MCSHTVDLSRPLSLLAATVRLMIAGQPSLNSSNVFPFLSLSLSLSLSGLSVQGVGRREQIGKSAYFAHASFSFRDSRSPSSSSSCVLVMRRNFPVRGHTHITSTKVLFFVTPSPFYHLQNSRNLSSFHLLFGDLPPSSTHCGRHMCVCSLVCCGGARLQEDGDDVRRRRLGGRGKVQRGVAVQVDGVDGRVVLDEEPHNL